MVKKILNIMIMTCVLCACQNKDEEVQMPEAEGSNTVTFNVINYRQESMDGVTRAMKVDELDHLDMAIYNADSHELIDSLQTKKGDKGYASFTATLLRGKYIFVFLGYNGTRTANLKEISAIKWPDNYVPHCFLKTIEVDIPTTEHQQTIALSRVVAAFVVKSKGANPQDLSTIEVKTDDGGYTLNAESGLAREAASRSYTYNVETYAGKDSITVNFFTFLTTRSNTISLTMTARDKEDKVLRERDFIGVPMEINQRTIFNGNFFAEDVLFPMTLEEPEWKELNKTF